MIFKKKERSKAVSVNQDNFEDIVNQKNTAILLDFWASWCGPCKILGPFIDELAGDFKDRAIIGKVNLDQNPELSKKFKIKSIPTLIFIKNRNIIEQISGLIPKPNLTEMVEDLIAYKFEEEE